MLDEKMNSKIDLYQGEITLRGGHFGHFHNIYVKYISAKCIAFNFGFHFWYLGLIFWFSQS